MDYTVKFELEDAAGASVQYITHLHPADIGVELSFEVVGVLGEPLMKVLGNLKDAAKTAAKAASGDVTDEELDDVFEGLDLGAALASLRSLDPKSLSSLSKRVLSQTFRNGNSLKDPLKFGEAYRGNYGELYLAVWKVIEANRFIPLLGTSSEIE